MPAASATGTAQHRGLLASGGLARIEGVARENFPSLPGVSTPLASHNPRRVGEEALPGRSFEAAAQQRCSLEAGLRWGDGSTFHSVGLGSHGTY